MKAFHLRPSSAAGRSQKGGGGGGSIRGIEDDRDGPPPAMHHLTRPTTAPGPTFPIAASSSDNGGMTNGDGGGGNTSSGKHHDHHLSARPAFNRAHSSGPHPGKDNRDGKLHAGGTATASGLTPAASSTSLRTNASEAWTNPEETEGEFVRRTYLYFDIYGVKGDGTAEGKEWTRNRDAAQTPWNDLRQVSGNSSSRNSIGIDADVTGSAPSLQRSGSSRTRSRVKSSPHAQALREKVHSGRLSPSHSRVARPNTGTSNAGTTPAVRSSPLAMPPLGPGTPPGEEQPSSDTAIPSSSQTEYLADPPLREPHANGRHLLDPNDMPPASNAMLSPVMLHSRLSESELSEVSEIGTEDWGEHREAERRKRQELSTQRFGGVGDGEDAGDAAAEDGESSGHWQMLDRYGFFAQEWASQRGRISLLPAAAFAFVPSAGKANKGRGKAAAASKAAQGVVKETDSGVADANGAPLKDPSSSASASSASRVSAFSSLRQSGNDAARQKEQERIAKWANMLDPVERRGGNTAFFKIKDEFVGSDKLLSRVIKGIPDRWRAAAWWAMLESQRDRHDDQGGGKGDGGASVETAAPLRGKLQRSLSTRSSKTRTNKDKAERASNGGGTTATSTAHRPARRRKDRNESLSTAILRRKQQDHTSRYHRLLGVSSPHDVQIDLDVPRTISNHIQFHTRYGQGQRSLFKVLHCFSLLCADCGYCQGMGSLTVTLLCYFPEEVAYSVLVSLHDSSAKFNLHQVFYPGFPGLMEQFHVQEHLMQLLLPSSLITNLEEEGITTSSYATRWYITNFYNVVPFETQLRLWDLFFLLGKDVLPVFAVAILHGLSLTAFAPPQHNNTRTPYDFEHLMSHLNHLFVPQSDDRLFAWIGQVLANKKTSREIAKARREWREKQTA